MPERNKKNKKLHEFERQVPHYIKDVGKQRVYMTKPTLRKSETAASLPLSKGGTFWDAVHAMSRKQVEKVSTFNLYQLGGFFE
jgi:hypothetical protein